MIDIEFEVSHPWDEKHVAWRVARIVSSKPRPFKIDQGLGDYKWQLDPSNDWWIHPTDDSFKYRLIYRYGDDALAEALMSFLQWVFR